MKKIILLISILLIVIKLSAQKIDLIPISFGIKAGYVYSDIDISTYEDFRVTGNDKKSGTLLGVYVRINLKKWYIQPELNYISQKVTVNTQVDSRVFEQEYKIYTSEIPLKVGYKFLDLKVVKLRIFGGPVLTFKLDDKIKILNGGNSVSNAIPKSLNSVNWAFRAGLGIDVLKFNLDIAYQKGLSDISDNFLKEADLYLVTLGFNIF